MDTTPREDELWEGIGGHFESINQVISEFIDNSIANFKGNDTDSRDIIVHAEERENSVNIRIEDTGTGIIDFEPVLRIGDKSIRESPLNEHGFGLKHAMASADPENRNWSIYTQTKSEASEGKFRLVTAPYRFDMDAESKMEPWPGQYASSGTLIEFECTRTFFDTLQQGVPGSAGFDRCLDYLVEDIGYKYSGVISEGGVSIQVRSTSGYSEAASATTPDWIGYYEPRSGTIDHDLGDGEVTIEYQFGEVSKSDYVRHYKRNMDTSGVEVQLNGRVMTDNLFSEVWDLEPHPQYNHFLVVINVKSEEHDRLPTTKTAKNGIRSGDEKLQELFKWIRNTRPDPPKQLTNSVREADLVEELKDNKERHTRSPDSRVEAEFSVYESIDAPVDVDLYYYDGHDVVLYEAKKDTADLQALYQLLMYWDGAVRDGLDPTEGILIAKEISAGVEEILSEFNTMIDQNGNKYNFSFKEWEEEGVDYPST